MLSVEEAIARILTDVPSTGTESVVLSEAYGRVLAEHVRSQVDVPPWNNSSMDGYAVIAADTASGSAALTLLQTVGAGEVSAHVVRPGTAVAIMTGAPMPQGADAIVIVEDTDAAREGTVQLRAAAEVGQHVRLRGEDVEVGARVLEAGSRLTPAAVGLASSVGRTSLEVARRPVVAVLSTGDEVIAPGQPLGPGQIWSSNNASLVGLVLQAGGLPLDLGTVGDDLGETVEALRRAAREADVVVTTGGVSVGVYDVVREAFVALGAEVDFWKVRMKPGKPLAFGRISYDGRQVPLFGLPGNPVSCVVNFLQFVRPWMRVAMRDTRPYLPVVAAVAGVDFHDRPGRARLLRVRLESRADGVLVAMPSASQSSGVLTSVARGHGLLLVGTDAEAPLRGQAVRVQLYDPEALDGESPGYGW